MKFVGVALAGTSPNIFLRENVPAYFEYFLNPKNHKPGIPMDMISYHFYAGPTADQSPEVQQYTFFDQAAGFRNSVRYLESIRQRLSPKTQTDLDELGCIPADDNAVPRKPIPDSYWNLCGRFMATCMGNYRASGLRWPVNRKWWVTPRSFRAFPWWIGLPGDPMPVTGC
jgi:hypothetical protein